MAKVSKIFIVLAVSASASSIASAYGISAPAVVPGISAPAPLSISDSSNPIALKAAQLSNLINAQAIIDEVDKASKSTNNSPDSSASFNANAGSLGGSSSSTSVGMNYSQICGKMGGSWSGSSCVLPVPAPVVISTTIVQQVPAPQAPAANPPAQQMYVCPLNHYTPPGAWASYGCNGQISAESSCSNNWFSGGGTQSLSYACSPM